MGPEPKGAIIEIAIANYRANGAGTIPQPNTNYEGRAGPRKAGMDAAAALLETTPYELTQRVRSGERLAEIAAEVNVGSDTLNSVMAEAITASSASPAVAHRLVSQLPNIIAGNRQRQPSPVVEAPAEAKASLADQLKVEVQKVQDAIEDGSLRELMADRGVEARLGILVNKKL